MEPSPLEAAAKQRRTSSDFFYVHGDSVIQVMMVFFDDSCNDQKVMCGQVLTHVFSM